MHHNNLNNDRLLLLNTYKNKIENSIAFKIKIGWYPQLLTPETIKLLGSTKNNVLHLEITGLALAHCNNNNNDYQQDSRVLYTFIRN